MSKILWWIVKHCIFFLDRDDLLMVHSFVKDDITDYHIIVERSYPDKHYYGTTIETYEEKK